MERIGHRGAPRELPENTIAAFERAFRRGADAIELDVHATRDGVVVVHHDALVRPAGRKRRRRIARLTWDELSAIPLRRGGHVPRLTDVLAIVPPRATAYVEIKGKGIEALVARVLEQSRTHAAVHAFNHRTVQRMYGILPRIPRGLLFERSARRVAAAMHDARARDIWLHWRLINATVVERVHDAGGRVIAWTVNSRARAKRLAALGVDGLCTDDVRLLDGL